MSDGSASSRTGRGPFWAKQLSSGDPYELTDGHAIRCLPTGGRGSRGQLVGATAIESDPEVEEAGVDTGYAPSEQTLRAPDIAIGNVPDRPGWVQGAPPLAVEYADTGQDERDLELKITELLQAGTRHVWVVRLAGPRHVEVHEPNTAVRVVPYDGELRAPGILRNPVPVAALYDRDAAHEVTLRNLLQRRGYESLDAVRSEGKAEGTSAAILRVLEARGLVPSEAERRRVTATTELALLETWLARAVTAPTVAAVFAE